MRIAVGFFVCFAFFPAVPAAAQENPLWPERTIVSLNVPVQALNNDFTEKLSVADTVRRNENATLSARYESVKGPLVDLSAAVRLAKRVGVGVAVSWMRRSSASTVDLSIPNPLVANAPLTLSALVSDLDRNEIGVHIQALYALSLGRRTRLIMSGGPTVFVMTQDLVDSVAFERLPGFTGIQFADADIRDDRNESIGFNVGADVMWTLTSHFGVGTLARYSRATMTLSAGSASGVDRSIDVHAGGLHLGGGIRVLF